MTEKEAPPLDAAGQSAASLSSYPPVSRTTIHGKASLVFSLPFLLAGATIVLVALEVIHVDPSTVHAPMWVIGAAGGAFFLAGLSLFAHAVAGLRRMNRLNAQLSTRPNEPWFADYEWNPEGLESRGGSSIWTHALGLSVMLCFMSIFNWVAFKEDGFGLFGFVAGFFDLIFAIVIGSLAYKAFIQATYGRPTLEFGDFPVRPGQRLRVRITSNRDLGEADSLTARLRFIEERYETRGTGKQRTQVVVCYERYADVQELHGSDARKLVTGGLELDFLIPDSAESSELRARPALYWDLELHAEIPGPDFKHRFLIPVYGEASRGSNRLAA